MVVKQVLLRYIRLMSIYAKMDLGSLLRDTKFMLIAIVSDICASMSAMSGIFLLAWKFDGIGGLDRFEVLFMLAYSGIVHGVIEVLDRGNASYPSRIIGRGQWEHMFIMPQSYVTQLFVCFSPFTCSGKLISGIIMMHISIRNLPNALPGWWLALLLINIAASIVIVVASSYLLSTLAFYAPVQCEEIASAVRDSMEYTSTFPLSGMPKHLKVSLLSFFPAGLVAWLPTLLILGKMPLGGNIYLIVFTLLLSFIATYFFKKGFAFYVQTGINRYSPGGHRS